LNKRLYLIIILLLGYTCLFAQPKSNSPFVTVSGTVYDISARRPLEAVAVISTSGRGTITDSLGRYSLTVKTTDSIWFSLINKSTIKYPVDTIKNTNEFNVMIHVRAAELPEVKVRNRNYRLDSIQNRNDYAKYFNFKKPSLKLSENNSYNPGGVSVGLDLDEIINMFRFKRNRSLEALQKRLIQQEQDKYIDHRFNKQFVRKITKLQSPELEAFMQKFRPDYDFLTLLNDLEFGYYIEKCYEQYKGTKPNSRKKVFRSEFDYEEKN
jgi:hypothetical protein